MLRMHENGVKAAVLLTFHDHTPTCKGSELMVIGIKLNPERLLKALVIYVRLKKATFKVRLL